MWCRYSLSLMGIQISFYLGIKVFRNYRLKKPRSGMILSDHLKIFWVKYTQIQMTATVY